MKKIIAFIVTLFLAACLLFSVSAADKITVMLDGSEIKFDVPPQIISGRTMVPIRAIFEALGAEVEWNDTTKTVTATIDDYVVECTINSKVMTVCGEKVEMDVSPVIIQGRTLMPARFAAEAFDCKVGWADPIKTAFITSYGYTNNAFSKGDQ